MEEKNSPATITTTNITTPPPTPAPETDWAVLGLPAQSPRRKSKTNARLYLNAYLPTQQQNQVWRDDGKNTHKYCLSGSDTLRILITDGTCDCISHAIFTWSCHPQHATTGHCWRNSLERKLRSIQRRATLTLHLHYNIKQTEKKFSFYSMVCVLVRRYEKR